MELIGGHIQANIRLHVRLNVGVCVQMSIIWSILIIALTEVSDGFLSTIILNKRIAFSWLLIIRSLLDASFDNLLLVSVQT